MSCLFYAFLFLVGDISLPRHFNLPTIIPPNKQTNKKWTLIYFCTLWKAFNSSCLSRLNLKLVQLFFNHITKTWQSDMNGRKKYVLFARTIKIYSEVTQNRIQLTTLNISVTINSPVWKGRFGVYLNRNRKEDLLFLQYTSWIYIYSKISIIYTPELQTPFSISNTYIFVRLYLWIHLSNSR